MALSWTYELQLFLVSEQVMPGIYMDVIYTWLIEIFQLCGQIVAKL